MGVNSENELQELLEIYYSCAEESFSKRDAGSTTKIVKFLGDGFFAVSEYKVGGGREELDAAFLKIFEAILAFRTSFRGRMKDATFTTLGLRSGFGMSYGASFRFNVKGHKSDYSGGQINLASRLCSVAEADQLVMESELQPCLKQIYSEFIVPFPHRYTRIRPKGLNEISVAKMKLSSIRRRAVD